MPLVRIAHKKGHPEGFGRRSGELVYEAMKTTLNVPDNDHFQIITEHDEGLVYDPVYLGIDRTDGIVIIQITLNEGRSVEMKKAFYMAVAQSLNRELNVRMEDVLISLVEVKKENWSFGNGVAQYA